ncbi:hypothetical protein ACX0MV_20100 [Pseudomonas borbori]
MEAIIVLVIIVILVVLIAKALPNQPSLTEYTDQYSSEQLQGRSYKISKKLAKLTTESTNIICNLQATKEDIWRYERLKNEIAVLEKENQAIKAELITRANATKKTTQELSEVINSHATLVILLMKEKGLTEDQANTAILNKIEARKNQYQLKGLSEEQALEKNIAMQLQN